MTSTDDQQEPNFIFFSPGENQGVQNHWETEQGQFECHLHSYDNE